MNVNRQNNCCSGRSGKPNVIITPTGCNAAPVPASPCCNAISAASCCNVASVQPLSCCNDGAAEAVIVGGSTDAACNKEIVLRDFPIAMAYVPWQDYGNICAPPQALKNGTIFRELDLDFAERRCN